MAGRRRVELHDRPRPAEAVARVAREHLRLPGSGAPVPDDVHAVGVGGDRRHAREARVVEQWAAERAIAAGVRAVVGRLEPGDRRHRPRPGERAPCVGRPDERDRVRTLLAGVDAVGQVDGAVGADREVGELLGGPAVGDPGRLGVGLSAVGRAREEDDVIAVRAAEARPRDVDIAVALVGRDVDLVLEQPGDRRRAALDARGKAVARAVVVVAGDVDRAVGRLRAVEADEAVVKAPAAVERLRRVAGGGAAALRRRLRAERRGVVRIAGDERIAPVRAAVGRAVVARPLVARATADLGAVVVGAGDDDVGAARVHGHARLVLAPATGAAALQRRVRPAVGARVRPRRPVVGDQRVRPHGLRAPQNHAECEQDSTAGAAKHERSLSRATTVAAPYTPARSTIKLLTDSANAVTVPRNRDEQQSRVRW